MGWGTGAGLAGSRDDLECPGRRGVTEVADERRYLDEARRAADYLVETRGDDGHWCQHGGPCVNTTAEYVFELRWFVQVQKMLFWA